MAKRIGLFGGSFDPPHVGHVILAEALAEACALDAVWFLPTWCSPHKVGRHITEAVHRRRMLELAIAGNPRFEINDYELNLGQPAFTVDTVRHFRQTHPETRFFWFIGADSLADLPSWRSPQELVEQVDVVTAVRGGLDIDAILANLDGRLAATTVERLRANVVRTPAIEVASSDIRKRLAEGRSIRYLVCDSVRKYIEDNRLYTTCLK